MKDKKQYDILDDIGFIGVQDKRTKAQEKKDIDDMEKYIKSVKAGKGNPFARKKKRPSIKNK